MNYEYIERLVSAAKAGDVKAKENLSLEFTPLIASISKKTFIHDYLRCDLENECFLALFTCLSKYDLNTHRFVAYATNAIKNNIGYLIRKDKNRNELDGFSTLYLNNNLEEFLPSKAGALDEDLCCLYDYNRLSFALNNKLNDEEKQLISFIFFKNNTLTNYAYFKNISYVAASKRKKNVLKKLNKYINGGNESWQLMI